LSGIPRHGFQARPDCGNSGEKIIISTAMGDEKTMSDPLKDESGLNMIWLLLGGLLVITAALLWLLR
jgi:hypothetical protein